MTKLKEQRILKGLSQSQLATKSGVNLRMIQHYEQERKDIKKAQITTVISLADALGVSVEDIL